MTRASVKRITFRQGVERILAELDIIDGSFEAANQRVKEYRANDDEQAAINEIRNLWWLLSGTVERDER